MKSDVESAPDLLVGVVRDDSKLDGAALAVGQLGQGGRQVVVHAVEPGVVGGVGNRFESELEPVAGRPLQAAPPD